MGHKFSLILSREITDDESTVLQESGCYGASFVADKLPTDAEVAVTKVDIDDTVSPSLEEAIESALEAAKKVPDLGVPGLIVPGLPVAKKVDGEVIEDESSVGDEDEDESSVGDEKDPVEASATEPSNGQASNGQASNGQASNGKASAKKPSTRKPSTRKASPKKSANGKTAAEAAESTDGAEEPAAAAAVAD